MDLPRKVREELNALSKEVFGASSKWQKMLKGYPELVTRKVIETVPGDNGAPDTTKETQVPVLLPNGAKEYRIVTKTVEEVKEMLLNFKKMRDDMIAKQKIQQDLQNLSKQIQEEAAGHVRG